MITFTLTLTLDDGLNLRMACGDAIDEWYDRAKRPDVNVDACQRIAENYSRLWDHIRDAMERAEHEMSD